MREGRKGGDGIERWTTMHDLKSSKSNYSCGCRCHFFHRRSESAIDMLAA